MNLRMIWATEEHSVPKQANKQINGRKAITQSSLGHEKPTMMDISRSRQKQSEQAASPYPCLLLPTPGREARASWPSQANWNQMKEGRGNTPKCPASQPLSKLLDLSRLTLVSTSYSLPPWGMQMNTKKSKPGQG